MKEYSYYLQAEGKSEKTISHYLRIVEHFQSWLKKNDLLKKSVESIHLNLYREDLIAKYKPSTINNYIIVMKHYFHYLYETNQIDFDIAMKLKGVKNQVPPLNRGISKNEVRKLIIYLNQKELYDKNPWRATRNKAILYLIIFAGLRRSEITHLKLEDIKENLAMINDSKHSNYRIIPLHKEIKSALYEWLQYRGEIDHSYVFTSQKGGGLSERAINHLFESLQEKGYEVYPHLLRHYFATQLNENHVPLDQIRALLGHVDIKTTIRYLDKTEENLAAAINTLKL